MAKIHKDAPFSTRENLQVEGVVTYGGLLSKRFADILPEGEILRLDYEPADPVHGIGMVPKDTPSVKGFSSPMRHRALPLRKDRPEF
jgi:hypothetical protein